MGLEELIAAMKQPAFYPDHPAGVEVRQTHISCVFLAGDFVYKIKKPLRFAFLDYSTLERRYHFACEEVRLNRRLAPRVYLGVFPILQHGQSLVLGAHAVTRPHPRAADYAVKMRRLPDDRSLERLVREHRIDPAGMRRVAAVLAHFHAQAERSRALEYGRADAVYAAVRDNAEECRPFAGDTIGARELDLVGRFYDSFVKQHRELLDRRARRGMVREGHGDLRSEHVCVTDQIEIIDCVEFSEKLRYADIASDLGFLLMDLDRLEAPALGHELLLAYMHEIGDRELSRLLNFYKCHRAMVRGKVGSLKARESEIAAPQRERARQSARACFAAAYRYAKAGSPALIAVCGLPGSGKSTIARALSERSGFAVLNSDVIRKRLAGKAPTDRAGGHWRAGIYTREFTAATYRALAEQAGAILRGGDGVIIDATLKDAAQRAMLCDVARAAAVPIVFAQCIIGDAEAKRRLEARAHQADAVSDATWEIYLRHKAEFAQFGPDLAGCHLRLDAAANPALNACAIERFVAAIDSDSGEP